MVTLAPAEIYRERLERLKWGSALWCPEQSFGDIHIGDVGYIIGGTFQRLFHAPFPGPAQMLYMPAEFATLPFDKEKDIVTETEFSPAFQPFHSPKVTVVSREEPDETRCVL